MKILNHSSREEAYSNETRARSSLCYERIALYMSIRKRIATAIDPPRNKTANEILTPSPHMTVNGNVYIVLPYERYAAVSFLRHARTSLVVDVVL